MWHALERFTIHYASSMALTAMFYFGLAFWIRRRPAVGRWISPKAGHLLVVSGLAVFAVMPLREPFDTYFGTQPWWKAGTDQLSWLLGAASSVWALYRFRHSSE